MSQEWTTEQECAFIKHLGTYREGHDSASTRLALLETYVKAARERADWGKINAKRVIEFAETQLVEEQFKT